MALGIYITFQPALLVGAFLRTASVLTPHATRTRAAGADSVAPC